MVISTAKSARAATPDPIELSAPVTPAVFHILLALANRESHGYGIMQDVEQFTNGDKQLGPGTLYRSIQRMLVDGLIQELAIALYGESDDERRRYYRITAKGLAVARMEARRLADLVDAARGRGLLTNPPRQEKHDDKPGSGGLPHDHAPARRQRRGRGHRVVHKGPRRP